MTEVTSEEESLISQASMLLAASGVRPDSASEASKALMKAVPNVEHRAAYLASRAAINAAGMYAALRLHKKPMTAQTRAVFTTMMVVLESAVEMIRAALAYEGEADGTKH